MFQFRNHIFPKHFPEKFFRQINDTLLGHFSYFHVLYKDKVIASELSLFSDQKIYSFLVTTDYNSQILRPNEFLKYKIIE